jgi:hypothetical protein
VVRRPCRPTPEDQGPRTPAAGQGGRAGGRGHLRGQTLLGRSPSTRPTRRSWWPPGRATTRSSAATPRSSPRPPTRPTAGRAGRGWPWPGPWGHLTKRTIKHVKPWRPHAGQGQQRHPPPHLSVWSALRTDVRQRVESRQVRVDFRLFDRGQCDLSEFNLTGSGVGVLYSPFREG